MSIANVKNSAIHAIRSRRVAMVALGVAMLSLGSGIVQAQPLPQKEVSLAGLDLSRPDDAQEAYARLSKAARQVCMEIDMIEQRGMKNRIRCYKISLANAVNSVNNAHLTELHQSDKRVRVAQGLLKRSNAS